ncbi:bifunctional serine/threonine-protein kinase/formylglycine-generating enzyme family protein [Schlesneria paludicola]|uniref:bifunctional serine/threonine-protein kinase/formylglycine-generating enzyme family protein n=1 Tax=Schlesneria paludicola TaxID=360056 RepID=UPI00029AE5F0|nr:protein kinase [Schlesneria paludicola]
MSSGDLQFEDLQDLVGRELDGRYVLEKFIDRGGYGAVYRGNDKKFNQSVAIKVGLSSREFMKEARLAAEVKHNHIVQVSDFGSDKGIAYLVMEFLHGEDLEKLFKKQGSRLSPEQLRKFVNEVGDALAYAHADQLIHRDLKPRNIILREHVSKAGTSTGNSKFVLLDFGIAAKLDSEGTQRNRTQDGAGTVEYMAPELLGREPRATPQSDIYAFGVILYQMLTGQVPFPQADTSHMALAECLNAICRSAPPPFRDVAPDRHHPPAIETLVMQCLEKDPARRPASMSEVRERYLEAHDRAQKRPVTAKKVTRNLVNTIRPTDLIDDGEDDDELEPAVVQTLVRTPPPRSSGLGPWLFLLFAALCGGGWYAYKQITIPPASVSLTNDAGNEISPDTPVLIEAGTSVKLTYIVDLHRNAPLDFEVAEKPQGVDVALTNGPLPGTSQYVTISVTDLNPKIIEPLPIVLRAYEPGGSKSWERHVKISIGRPSLSWWPTELNKLKFSESPDSRRVKLGGKIFATIIQRDVAGHSVRFRLIPAKRIDDRSVDTFYIMERLVTNQMFNEFAKENVDFELTPRKPDERTWERTDLTESPVTDICVLEAQKFAWWLGGPQIATLPSTLEWELAAGYRDFIRIIKEKNGETSIENIGDDKLRDFKRVKFEGHPLGATAWIGVGPTLGLYQDVDGEQLNERSPYGCLFPPLPDGRRAIEFTSSLNNTLSFKTSDLRIICQHGIPNQHDPVLKDYSAVMRGAKEATDEKEIQWVTEYQGSLKIKTDSDLTDEVGECPLRVIDRPDGRKSSWSFRVVLLPDISP